jgi:hypothetical protein
VHLKRKILFNQFDFCGIFLQHLLEERIKPRTVWSLVIAEYGDEHWCVFKALEC